MTDTHGNLPLAARSPVGGRRPPDGVGQGRRTGAGTGATNGSRIWVIRRVALAYTVAMTFRVVLEHDPVTGDYSAVCPELPGCASAGETEEEALANIREAIEL